MKRLVDDDTRRAIADAVTAIEQQTCAELVTVLAPASASYGEYALLWSAIITLVVSTAAHFAAPALLAPAWQPMLPFLAPALFMALTLALRLPSVLRHVVPKHIQHRNAMAMARVQFLAQQLHHTRQETGLLIFVSEFEHYVEILADRGIARHVPERDWQALVDAFTRRVASDQVREGFLETIAGCGKLLAKKLPASGDNPNELPNRLVVIE